MPNNIQIKRRTTVTGVGGITLLAGELLWQEFDKQLMIGKSDNSIVPIGGDGYYVTLSTSQEISGAKTFSSPETNFSALPKFLGVSLTANATDLNKLTSTSAQTNDFNNLSGVAAGTVTANKYILAGTNNLVDFGAGNIKTTFIPLLPEDVANKKYVDTVAQGLDIKNSVFYGTIAPLPACVYNNGSSGEGATLLADENGPLTIDGVAVADGDSVLVKNQVDSKQNGIYLVSVAGAANAKFVLTRRIDADASGKLNSGSFVFIERGTNAGTGWVLNSQTTVVVGSTPLAFTQFSSGGAINAGDGLQSSGGTLSVKTVSQNRISVGPSGVDLATMTGLSTGSEFISFSVDTYGRVTAASKTVASTAGITIDCGVIN